MRGNIRPVPRENSFGNSAAADPQGFYRTCSAGGGLLLRCGIRRTPSPNFPIRRRCASAQCGMSHLRSELLGAVAPSRSISPRFTSTGHVRRVPPSWDRCRARSCRTNAHLASQRRQALALRTSLALGNVPHYLTRSHVTYQVRVVQPSHANLSHLTQYAILHVTKCLRRYVRQERCV
jgi:hypothetical protein